VTTPYTFAHNAFADALQTTYAHLANGEESGVSVNVAGRLMLLRRQGKLAFGTMRDSSGEIQLFALTDLANDFEEFTRLHLGDWVGVTGEVVRTKRGELSVKVRSWVRLAEALHNFGDKWAGITDYDLRYRHREADLWANPMSRTSLRRRSEVIRSIRERCWAQNFLEVETPILNVTPTGAAAKPFKTYYNALASDFFLRIAPELWLKRLVVGGFERVFEVGRVFRNEGVSPRHNPEFTMLELYAAYWNYEDMMRFTEELVAGVAMDVLGTTEVEHQGRPFSFAAPWPRRTMAELTSEAAGELEAMNIDEDYIKALEWGLPPTAGLGLGMDRLAVLIADEDNIREVIAFPTLKPLRD
jgi:lysyl-tRNA synthetase class 2